MSASRELLFGLLALQNNFIDRAALVRAFDAWALDKAKSLADYLVEQRSLTGEERQLLNALVGKFFERHDGDADRSLAVVGKRVSQPPVSIGGPANWQRQLTPLFAQTTSPAHRRRSESRSARG